MWYVKQVTGLREIFYSEQPTLKAAVKKARGFQRRAFGEGWIEDTFIYSDESNRVYQMGLPANAASIPFDDFACDERGNFVFRVYNSAKWHHCHSLKDYCTLGALIACGDRPKNKIRYCGSKGIAIWINSVKAQIMEVRDFND